VFFVDDDPARDAQAQQALAAAAHAAGLRDVVFQYEPLAAAFDYERHATHEQLVLVADIGGGPRTSRWCAWGPSAANAWSGATTCWANHGVHVAGTDFDRRIELAAILGELGYGALGPARPRAAARGAERRVLRPRHLAFDQHRLQPARVAELKRMPASTPSRTTIAASCGPWTERLGHELAARAEAAKIAVAQGERTTIDLSMVEANLAAALDEGQAVAAIDADVGRIVDAALETVHQAGLAPQAVDALYFTGGSTGLRLLTDRLAAAFPQAAAVRGDRLSSVATGLGSTRGAALRAREREAPRRRAAARATTIDRMTPPPASAPTARPASCTELFVAFTGLALQGFGGVLRLRNACCARSGAGSRRQSSSRCWRWRRCCRGPMSATSR
jgi:hypothetical chaperone protein